MPRGACVELQPVVVVVVVRCGGGPMVVVVVFVVVVYGCGHGGGGVCLCGGYGGRQGGEARMCGRVMCCHPLPSNTVSNTCRGAERGLESHIAP